MSESLKAWAGRVAGELEVAMSRQKTVDSASWQVFLGELFQTRVYKKTQGRVTRQVTFVSLLAIVVISAWTLYETLKTQSDQTAVFMGAPLLMLAGGVWLSYRVVNTTRFAEFLINVEAEMTKVSWPTWAELRRSSAVVIFVMFLLAFLLFFYDFIWQTLFTMLGVG